MKKVETDFMRRNWFVSPQRSTISKFTILIVPRHVEVVGNERADTLTDIACTSEDQSTDQDDITIDACSGIQTNEY